MAAAPGVDAPAAGSDVMMLTGGIEADDGNSALVGLPVGAAGCSPANAAAAELAGAAEPGSVAAEAPLQAGV